MSNRHFCKGRKPPSAAAQFEADPQFTSVAFANPINGSQPDPRPAAGSPALDPANAAAPTGPGVDASATFLGAFNQNLWIDDWTVWNTQ